jgi:hypothetical protein
MAHIEAIAGDLVTYREAAEITGQALTFMCDAMVKHIDDPALVAEVLDEMTTHANELLKPTGLAIGWRMP